MDPGGSNVINGLDLFAAFTGTSLVRLSPYVTQASGPAHRGPVQSDGQGVRGRQVTLQRC
jgi:hypothetical protein